MAATDGTTTEGPCQGAECCEMGEVFCGDVCCTVGEVCSFQKCVIPGVACESGSEVVVCGVDDKPRAYKPDGTLLWTAQAMTCFMPSIADLDADGKPEVIVEGGILDGATGTLKAAFAPALDTAFIVSDLDSDGLLDVITASRGYHADGQVFVNTGLASQTSFYGTSDWKLMAGDRRLPHASWWSSSASWPAAARSSCTRPRMAVIRAGVGGGASRKGSSSPRSSKTPSVTSRWRPRAALSAS